MTTDLSKNLLDSPAFRENKDPGAAPKYEGPEPRSFRDVYDKNSEFSKARAEWAETTYKPWKEAKAAYDADPRNMGLSASFRDTPKAVNEYLQGLKGMYDPLMGDFTKDLGNLDVVADTRKSMQKAQGLLAGRNAREAARYGSQSDPTAQAYQQYQSQISDASTAAGMLNDARVTQEDMSSAGRMNMINLGRQMTGEANAAAGIAGAGQARIDSANASADAAAKAQKAQMAATAMSMIMMAAFV